MWRSLVYAVFEVAGNQYRAEVGDKVQVERLPQEVGAKVEIDKVLMVADGENVTVGKPTVAGAKVVASVTEQSKGPRTLIFQYRIGGKRHRTQATHRQDNGCRSRSSARREGQAWLIRRAAGQPAARTPFAAPGRKLWRREVRSGKSSCASAACTSSRARM
jgi:large subunit ribosomal protein L21